MKVKVGDKVWKSGGAFGVEELITVTDEDVNIVNEFWGRMYYDSQKEAKLHTCMAHGEYGSYQEACVRGGIM